MSDTIPAPAPVATNAAVNRAVAEAKSLPQLVRSLETDCPPLAQAIEGKSLIASRTPWGVAVGYAAAWASTKYGLGWDADTCALVSGVIVLAASYAMRWITAGPIRGVFVHKPVAPR